MKLTDKRFWIWLAIIALMPVMMDIFGGVVLIHDLFIIDSTGWELFFVWEIAYLTGGLLSYRKMQGKGWIKSAFTCWTIVCPLIVILSFLWASIRIVEGFQGLAYFVISCISLGGSIIPLFLGTYLYKRHFPTD